MTGGHDRRLDVCDTVYAYATGIDNRDWAAYRSAFDDHVDIDFSSWNGRPPAGRLAADDWVAGLTPLFGGLDASQHSLTNPRVELESDDRAVCTVYMQAEHVLRRGDEDVFFTIGGFYRDRLRRGSARWLLTGVTLVVWWRRGDFSIMAEATERGRASLIPPAAPSPERPD